MQILRDFIQIETFELSLIILKINAAAKRLLFTSSINLLYNESLYSISSVNSVRLVN